MNLYQLTIHEAADLLGKKEISSRGLTQSVLDRIAELDPKLGAYITVCTDTAMAQAESADRRISEGRHTPLTGIPVAIKDLMCTKGIPTTCGSKILENFIPPYDATVVGKLKEAGAVLVGKLNMDEFAMGSTTENSGFHPTRNPWNLECIPGGSSGGSAAAVAADMCLGALGSDTGGSIRQPASHCGVVGMKPTYGRVSRFGLVAFASSLDQIGPLAKDVTDCAMLMDGIAGYDPRDSTSVPDQAQPLFEKGLGKEGLADIRVGIPVEYWETDGLDPEVARSVSGAIDRLKEMGATSVEVSLPHTKYVVAAYYVIAPCEASSNLARYDGVKYGHRDMDRKRLMTMYRSTRSGGFGTEVQRRIIIGTYALSAGYYDAYYRKASQVRTLIRKDFSSAFEKCDIIVSPVAPTPAMKLGDVADDPLRMYLSDIFTLSANMAGIPGISIPCGLSSEGLPVGAQMMGRHFSEPMLLRVAHQFEQATDFHKKRPGI